MAVHNTQQQTLNALDCEDIWTRATIEVLRYNAFRRHCFLDDGAP